MALRRSWMALLAGGGGGQSASASAGAGALLCRAAGAGEERRQFPATEGASRPKIGLGRASGGTGSLPAVPATSGTAPALNGTEGCGTLRGAEAACGCPTGTAAARGAPLTGSAAGLLPHCCCYNLTGQMGSHSIPTATAACAAGHAVHRSHWQVIMGGRSGTHRRLP